MTTNEALTKMQEHAKTMTCRCVVTYNFGKQQQQCVYLRDNGDRCLFGAVIPDDRINLYGKSIARASDIIRRELHAGETWCKDLDPEIMDDAQAVHDSCLDWKPNKIIAELEVLKNFGIKHLDN